MYRAADRAFPRILSCLLFLVAPPATAAPPPPLRLDFETPPPDLELHGGLRIVTQGTARCLEFTTPLQYAALPRSRTLDGIEALTVTAWVYPRRAGEQYFVSRGLPTTDPLGNRLFPPQQDYVNFLLGTDDHGFLLGAAHGNGRMPFPFVTVNEVPIDAWSHLAVTKDARGYQRFYLNGALVASDLDSAHAPAVRPFADVSNDAPPLRLHMPLGGLIGQVSLVPAALSDDQIRAEFTAGQSRFSPTLPVRPVALRDMDQHPSPTLWNRDTNAGPAPAAEPPRLTRDAWPAHRARILENLPKILGTPPHDVRAYYARRDAIRDGDFTPLSADLAPQTLSEEDAGTYTRRKVTLQVQEGDRMYAWLLIPKRPLAPRAPAVICVYGTTSGAGKDTTVGLSGPRPGSPPEKNRDFALDFVNAGFVVLAPDYLRDGQRLHPGDRPYDTARFYRRYHDWSIHAKDAYDTSRAVDYLQSLPFVDPGRIAMTGHSYGGHSTIFATALEPRIKAAAASGPVSDFLHHGLHWAVPRGAGNSQSMPLLRPYVLAHSPHLAPPQERTTLGPPRPLPVTFYEFTALIAPRPLLVFQAVGERRPMEEENAAAVAQVYTALGAAENVRYLWHPGDHDYPPAARQFAVTWLTRAFAKRP
jgi:dienelactone hydrolase